MTRRLWLVLLFACMQQASHSSLAQPYPSKPVKILLSGGAGGPNDVQSRGIAQSLSQALGQPFVVENRAGAQGTLALEACARSAPDGYTLCSGATNNITYQPVLNRSLTYEPLRDFTPLAHTGFLDVAIIVHASVPARTMDELVALAKAKPRSLAWGSFGVNTSSFYFSEWLRLARGAQFLHVPYKSSIQSQQALLAGEVQANLYGTGQIVPQIKAGKIRALMVTGERRSPALPDVPSAKEVGMELPLRTWYALFLPAGAPRDLVAKLNGEINKAIADPVFHEKYQNALGLVGGGMSPEEFAAFLKRDREGFAQLAKLIGLKSEP
jgi:tripartite-type tricarboxylate transporter receptor subunit TctC